MPVYTDRYGFVYTVMKTAEGKWTISKKPASRLFLAGTDRRWRSVMNDDYDKKPEAEAALREAAYRRGWDYSPFGR